MRISQRSVEEVRESADIIEVASEFTALRRQGSRFVGLCPYPDHQEKTPSFSIAPDRGFYYCFGCQKGGDAIKLVTDLKSLSFTEAVSYLAERSGIELKYEGTSTEDSEAARERVSRRRNIHRVLAAATAYYHKYLLKSPSADYARQYLKDRGISPSTIEEFRLGYAPRRNPGFVGAARRLDLGIETLNSAGLVSSRGMDRFSGRITFPISDRRGRILGFGARALGDEQPKYLNTPETEVFNKRNLLYGFPQVAEAIRKERSAIVVEGYTDVLMLYQSGVKNAVATLGTATTPAHLRTLSGYADRIHVLFDPDVAGEKAVERAAETAAELKLDLRVLRLPEDPADWIREHSAEEFRELLSDSEPVLEYVFRRKADRARGADAASRSRMVSEVQSLLRKIEDPVFHREAVREASEALGLGPEVLQGPQARYATALRTSTRIPKDPLREAGETVLALILARPDLTADPLRHGVQSPPLDEPVKLGTKDFTDEAQAEIFAFLEERAGEDLDALLSDESARMFMDRLAALASEGEKLYPSIESIRQAWLRLRILNRQRAKSDTPDFDDKVRIHAEIQRLEEALRRIPPES